MLGHRLLAGLPILCAALLASPAAALAQHIDIGTPPVLDRAAPKAVPPDIHRLYEPTRWIDTMDRGAVRSAYWNDLKPTGNLPVEWTGNAATGDPGTTSQAFKEAAIRRVNWFRAMAGAPAWVTLNLEFSRKAQQAALMFSVNKALSHFPPTDWTHYTAEGAEAARNSNICIGFQTPAPGTVADPGCVAQYIEDEGGGNGAVGHRRWILFPQTQEMGTGDVPQNGQNWRANALWLFDGRFGDPRPPTREEFVAWPPPGYVPSEFVFRRWSFGFPQADFSGAAVSVTTGGQPVPVTLEAPATGFGDNTIVWYSEPPAGNAAAATGDVTHRVTISNVLVNGVSRRFTYDVIAFDPNVAGPGPEFPANGLVSAASILSGPLASEFWMDLYGQKLSTQDAWDPNLPTSLGGTAVTFTDSAQVERQARLHFVTPLRIQFLTPPNMAAGPGMIRVSNSLGSVSAPVEIVRLRPAIFSANTSGKGPVAGIWLRVDSGANQTSGFTASADPPPNSVNVPVDLGGQGDRVFLSIFGSGFRAASTITCKIGGVEVPFTSSGAQGQFAGLDQVNVGPIPHSLTGAANATIELFFDGVAANPVTVGFQ